MKVNLLFKSLFSSEFKSLSGSNYNNIIILIFINLFAVFCIGSSNSVLKYLEKQMANPYVNLVYADTDPAYIDFNLLQSFFERKKDEISKRFNIDDIDYYLEDYLLFSGVGSQNNYNSLKVVIIDDINHPIWKMMEKQKPPSSPGDSLTSFCDTDQKSFVFLTEKAYGKFYNDSNSLEICFNTSNKPGSESVILPIGGILKDLPFEYDLLLFKDCFQFLRSNDLDTDDVVKKYYLSSDNLLHTDLSHLSQNDIEDSFIAEGVFISAHGPDLDKIKDNLVTLTIPIVKNKYKEFATPDEYICWSFGSNGLKQIPNFQDYLTESKSKFTTDNKGEIKIDLSLVKSKKYLDIFKSFGDKLSMSLALIAILLIINYSIAIMNLHISQNKRNLGTLLAFGYNNNTITSFYIFIGFIMIFVSFLIGYIFNYLFGHFILNSIIPLMGLDVDEITYVAPDILESLFGFTIVPLAFMFFQINKLLKITPGDLIYNR